MHDWLKERNLQKHYTPWDMGVDDEPIAVHFIAADMSVPAARHKLILYLARDRC